MSENLSSGSADAKMVLVFLVQGDDPEGRPIFAYVALRSEHKEDFLDAQKNGRFYPEDYGVIIEAGAGEPDEAVRKRMEAEYRFDHAGMVDLDES